MSTQAKTSERFVALLRSINVGGHTVKMERLRELFTTFGYREVATYLASGNVIFTASGARAGELEGEIAAGLESALAFPVPTFVRRGEDLRAVSEQRPFPDGALDGGTLYIAFLASTPAPAEVERIEGAGTGNDLFAVRGSELYWLCRTRFSDSPFSGPALERLLGRPATVRNSATVRKLVERYLSAPEG